MNTGTNASNFGGWFEARGPNGIGLYAKGGANGYAARFNGMIESASGGIKFPDGSVQLTAARPLPRHLISVRSSEFRVEPGRLEERGVGCEINELATGGGIRTEDDPRLNIWINAPKADGSGWKVGISNYGTATRSVTVFAVCIRVQ